MRGLEEAYLPLDDPEIDALYTKSQLKILREQERRHAKKEVEKALGHWVDFFEKGGKYPKVGKVLREEGWQNHGQQPRLCPKAQEARKKRKRPGESAADEQTQSRAQHPIRS